MKKSRCIFLLDLGSDEHQVDFFLLENAFILFVCRVFFVFVLFLA